MCSYHTTTLTSRKTLLTLAMFITIFSGAVSTTFAQDTQDPFEESGDYRFAIGIRAGGTSGLTLKYFVSSNRALEGIVWAGRNHFGITGLYEAYTSAFGVNGLNWYYGGGAHLKYQDADIVWIDFDEGVYRGEDRFALGVDGIVGIEYKIPPIPVAISLDLKPNLEVWTTGGVGLGIDPGLGVKIAF